MDPRRSQRVSQALHEELAELVGYELADPRLTSVTFTAVLVTPDLRTAQVRVVCEEPGREAEALRALEGARHFIRRELASRLRLWRMPELHFEADRATETTRRVEHLLKRIETNRKKTQRCSSGSA